MKTERWTWRSRWVPVWLIDCVSRTFGGGEFLVRSLDWKRDPKGVYSVSLKIEQDTNEDK